MHIHHLWNTVILEILGVKIFSLVLGPPNDEIKKHEIFSYKFVYQNDEKLNRPKNGFNRQKNGYMKISRFEVCS